MGKPCKAVQLRILSPEDWKNIIDAPMRLQMLRNKAIIHWPEAARWTVSSEEKALIAWLEDYATGFYYCPDVEMSGKIILFEMEADMLGMIMYFNGREF